MDEQSSNQKQSFSDRAVQELTKQRRESALAEVKKRMAVIIEAEKTIKLEQLAIKKIEDDFAGGLY